VTPYGVLANLAAMPVVSAIVMPAGMLGLIAAPFGFDSFFWWLMGVGIDWMILVTEWVASLPGAVGRVTAFGTGTLVLASLGIILLGLLRTPLRWCGATALALSVVSAFMTPQPDILISGDGHNVGVRGRDGRLHLMKVGKDSFLVKEWLAADADARQVGDASLTEGVSCDDDGCVVQMADGSFVALTLKLEALGDDCSRALLLVTTRQVPTPCAATIVNAQRLRRQGAIALRRTRRGFDVDAVKPKGLDRPWAPASPGDADAETGTLGVRASAPSAVDATPAESDLQAED
jgi:competence protein ComEC